MTNIRSMRLYALSIPFNVSFQHTTKDRDTGASVVVRLESSDGVVGYGEGAPRSYVTGESVDTCFQHLSEILWPLIQAADLPSGDDPDLLARIDALLNDEGDISEVVAHHSARCAMELALLDLLTRTVGRVGAVRGGVRRPLVFDGGHTGIDLAGGRRRCDRRRADQGNEGGQYTENFNDIPGLGDHPDLCSGVRRPGLSAVRMNVTKLSQYSDRIRETG